MRPMVNDKFIKNAPGAQDYYDAQQNELQQLEKTGSYGVGSYLADSPWVAMAKIKGALGGAEADNMPKANGDLYTPNNAMSDSMDKMRQIALKRYNKQPLSSDEQQTAKEWATMKSGGLYMHLPQK